MMSMIESCGDACLSIPSSSPLKAPRIRQRKRGPLLSLSLLAASVSLGLSPSLSPALCSSLSADAPTTRQQLLTGNKFRKSLQVCKQRQSATHLRAVCSARVVEKVWEGTSSFVLWSPPLSTRVIDGWGSFWPRLAHFALQRVPPSQSQTTMHTRL